MKHNLYRLFAALVIVALFAGRCAAPPTPAPARNRGSSSNPPRSSRLKSLLKSSRPKNRPKSSRPSRPPRRLRLQVQRSPHAGRSGESRHAASR